jgi:hypothetical protein
MKAPSFVAAVGALERIKPAEQRPYVLVPTEVRLRAYAVSPAFRSLRHRIEDKVEIDPATMKLRQPWRQHGKEILEPRDQDKEIPSVWFFYALRGAVYNPYNCRTGPEVMSKYQTIADEINAACDDGRLDASPRHNSLAPPMRKEWIRPMVKSFGTQLCRVITFTDKIPTTGGLSLYYGIVVPVGLAFLLFVGFDTRTWILQASILIALASRLALVSFIDAALFPVDDFPRFLVPCHVLVLMSVGLLFVRSSRAT